MKFKEIGINIEETELINNTYRTYTGRKNVKFNSFTNFKTGRIAYEDAIFLPEGTYVLIKEPGKKDIIGKILYYDSLFQDSLDLYHNVAIVNINYNIDTNNKDRTKLDDSLVIDYIDKDIYFNFNKYQNKYLQIISYDYCEEDKWKFVRVEYGNPHVKIFYMYGYQYFDGHIYQKKDINSKSLECVSHINNIIGIYQEKEDLIKTTNIEFVKEINSILVPYEFEIIMVYILLLCFSFIFKDFIILWITETIFFVYVRKRIRKKYNK